MKLLIISGDRSLAEGKRGAFYNTLEEFHKYWDRIDIICPKIRNPKPIPYALYPIPFFGNVFVHPSPWPLIFQPLWIYREGLRILKNGKWQMANGKWVMTVHEYPPFYNGIGARLLWNKIRIPYILEIHHIPGFPKAADSKEQFYKNLTRFFIKADSAKTKIVRAVNKKQVPDFLIEAGVPGDKIIYIPSLYIDLNVFRPMGLDKKYDLVFVARLEKNKGISLLLKAVKFSIFNFQFPMKLLIIGSGPLKNELIQYVEKNGLKDNVFFSGWLETLNDVARAYNSAKIFINPSFNEGGPRVVLEAMACGLPVITTRVGAMLDVINDEESGLFTSWNPEEMSERIIWLLDRPEIQSKFSDEGLKIAKQFEKSAIIKNYADKLKEILQ